MMYLILDSSAFLSGKYNSIPPGFTGVYITYLVKQEVDKGAPSRILENLLMAGLEIKDPVTMDTAIERADRTGDTDKLSRTDLSIIALALELKDVKVVTDDFRIQNVLKSCDIDFEPAGELGEKTIKGVWSWTNRCKGCGRYFDQQQKNDECPICGSQVRKYKRK